ncbi:MAG: ABC transporter permease [Anaerocolumna sp.]
MLSFAFHFKNAVSGLAANKLLNLIIIVSIVVGMMYPIVACTISEGILQDSKLSEYKDPEHMAILEFFAPFMEQSELDTKIMSLTKGIDIYGYQTIYTVTAKCNKHNFLSAVAGYSSSFLSLEGYKLIEGRLITETEISEGKPVCMVRTNGENDIKAGDSLSFMGTSYEVVGIIRIPKAYGGIFIPYKAMEAFIGKNSLQYKITLQTKEEPNINEIKSNLYFADSVLSIGTAVENVKPYYESVWALIRERIGIGLIVLLFAVISIIMIIIGKAIDDQYIIGVKMSIGASGIQVFTETFLQNAVLMIIALLIDFILFPIVKHYYRLLNNYPDIWVFLVMIIICLIITFFVSLFGTVIVLRNKSVSGLLRKYK